jgi:hypothetical protein
MGRRSPAPAPTLALAVALAAVAAGAAACKRKEAAPDRRGAAAVPVPPPLAGKAFYRVDAGPGTPCTAGAPCEARLVLTALEGYKVNKDYPFKLVADPAPGLTVDGTGTFVLDDARSGTLTIRYRAAKAGTARLTGTFKLSVCTDEQCEIEQPKIELELPAS